MKFKGIFCVISLVLYQASAITLYCTKNEAGDELTATFRTLKTGVAQLEAYDGTNLASGGCTSSVVTVDAIESVELKITFSLNSNTQIVPTIEQSDCHVAVTPGPPDVFTFHIMKQSTAGMIKISDEIFTGTCDSDITVPQSELDNGGQTIESTLTATTVTAVSDSIEATLVGSTGTALTGAINIGDIIRLRLAYFPPSGLTSGEGVVGIHMFNVVLSGYSDFRTTFKLITSNGCINQTASSTLDMDEGPKYSAADSDAADPKYVYQTGEFKAPMLDGPAPKMLYVRFSYRKACTVLTQLECADQEQYCIDNALDRSQKRKKRDASDFEQVHVMKLQRPVKANGNLAARQKRSTQELGETGTMQFSVPIALYGEGSQAGRAGKGNTGTSSDTCRVPDMYWIIAVVLGVLLLVTMALCVFLVLRLRKETNQNDKIAEKIGHRNPAYY